MRTEPPARLVSLLVRLRLATAEQISGVTRRARSLSGDLPDFESVWVDALAQAHVLTPFQASEINAGRAESLIYGPYAVTHRLGGPHWASCFSGYELETGRRVHVYVVRPAQRSTADAVAALAELLARSAPIRSPAWPVVDDFGTTGQVVWATCAATEGISAADWMVESGRFPPPAVLHVAREMVQRLAELEVLNIVHGDIGACGLLLQPSGHVALPAAGLRGVVRPHEGYSANDLGPAAYDYLSPERVADAVEPSTASDLYACGCLWWHLLTGRPPLAGGDALAKLKAAHAARIADVRTLAPEVSDELADAIRSCLAREPAERPASFAELSRRLGPTNRAAGAHLAGLVARPVTSWQVVRQANRRKRRANRGAQWATAAAAVCVMLACALVPYWLFQREQPIAQAPVGDKQPTQATNTPAVAAVEPAAERRASEKPAPARVDFHVAPAAAALPIEPRPRDLVLPTDEVLRIEQLNLAPNTTVRGRGGRRAIVRVPTRGLVVPCDDVTFVGIDFVAEQDRRVGSAAAGALVVVRAQTAVFRRCSFSTRRASAPAAIAWSGSDASAAGGELVLQDCACDGVAAVVDRQAHAGCSLRLTNSLLINSGPILRLHHAPRAGESVAVALDRVTLRGAGGVLECHYRRLDAQPGRMVITAGSSALAGNEDTALVTLAGPDKPDALAASLSWQGHGSIVTPGTAIAVWRAAPGERAVLAEDELEVDGLVRSVLEFAGDIEGAPSDSAVTAWLVPLRSPDPPGAHTAGLSLPGR